MTSENVMSFDRLMNGEKNIRRLENVVETKDRKTLSSATAPKNVVAQNVGTAATAQIGHCHPDPQSLYLSCLLAS